MPKSAYIHLGQLTDPDGTQSEGVNKVAQYVWDTSGLAWVKMTQPGGGTGGGAVTVADGADVAEGSTTDAAVYGDSAGTQAAKLRGINAILRGTGTAVAPASASVTDADSVAVAANASRKKMVVINTGASNVYFGDGFSAVAGGGITLIPNGTWVMDWATFTTNAIHAVCDTGKSSTLAIQEYQ